MLILFVCLPSADKRRLGTSSVVLLFFTHVFSVIFFTREQHISSIHISHIPIVYYITFHHLLPPFLHLFIFTPENGVPFDVLRIAEKLSYFQDSSILFPSFFQKL